MRASILGGVALSILVAGSAGAQQPQGDPAQQQRHDQMLRTVPGENGKEEPSSHAPTQSAAVFVNGALSVPGAAAETQTTPAKFSDRKARLDARPLMAFPLSLDEAQRQRIIEAVKSWGAAAAAVNAQPAQELPPGVDMRELPRDADVGPARGLKYVKVQDGVLLVSPFNRIVVGKIGG